MPRQVFVHLSPYVGVSQQVFDSSWYSRNYVILNLTGIVGALIAGMALFLTTIRASVNLHQDMLDTVLHVPIRYVLGRVLLQGIKSRMPID